MLFTPAQSWGLTVSNVSALRPVAAWGTTVTPGTAGTKGAWATAIAAASVVSEIFGIYIVISNGSSSATTRNHLVDIGIDPAGGTAFTVAIPDLLGGHAAPITVAGGICYYFPLYIPQGSTIGVRATGTVATTFSVALKVFGRPRRPDIMNCGSKVVAFGATLASATGTTVVPGTTAEGAWTQLGVALTTSLWWWQAGMTVVDTTMAALAYSLDLSTGNAASKDICMTDTLCATTAAEQLSLNSAGPQWYDRANTGDLVYGRIQCSGTADTAVSMMAWGLG